MTKGDPEEATALGALRDEIDRIDHILHDRLIERGEIIDRLIAAKARRPGTSAFRPEREADMMRRLVGRHHGILPLATVESIWRIIISTFTYVQAPYTVHAEGADLRMRDSARFHFGFTVPLSIHDGADGVIRAVAAASGDLGLVRAEGTATPWWQALTPPDAPKIIARLPFVERADHAAGLPLFIVAKPLDGAASRETILYAVATRAAADLQVLGTILAATDDACIVAVADDVPADALAEAAGTGTPPAFIGSHATRFEIASARF